MHGNTFRNITEGRWNDLFDNNSNLREQFDRKWYLGLIAFFPFNLLWNLWSCINNLGLNYLKAAASSYNFLEQVRRVQNFVETLDNLKGRNSNPNSNSSNAVSVATKWETFDSGVGSLSAPPSSSSGKITQDWEQFD